MFKFKAKKTPQEICNTMGRQLLEEGLSFYAGDYRWLPAYDEIVEWIAGNNGRGLLCVGNYGLGKTVICTKILPAMFDAWGWDYIIVSAYEMSRKIDEMKRHDIVVVDDFGVEGEAVIYGERRHIFNELVDFAEREGVLLILTSNLTGEEMRMKYGVRTLDRLRQITRAVVFQGESLRSEEKEKVVKLYVNGVAFSTVEEADAFEQKQTEIRAGIKEGRYRLYDDWAQEAYEMNEALELREGVVYKYEEKQK